MSSACVAATELVFLPRGQAPFRPSGHSTGISFCNALHRAPHSLPPQGFQEFLFTSDGNSISSLLTPPTRPSPTLHTRISFFCVPLPLPLLPPSSLPLLPGKPKFTSIQHIPTQLDAQVTELQTKINAMMSMMAIACIFSNRVNHRPAAAHCRQWHPRPRLRSNHHRCAYCGPI